MGDGGKEKVKNDLNGHSHKSTDWSAEYYWSHKNISYSTAYVTIIPSRKRENEKILDDE